jgi:germacradienol/geosmin synthase
MPQDVTFDLPFDTPVSDHLEYARARHLRWVWDMGLVRSQAGFEEYRSWDLPQAAARTYPHASAADMVVLMNWFSLAFLFDDQFDASQPDRADRILDVARELIVTPLRPMGSRPRVVCPITVAWTQVWDHLSDGMSLTWRPGASRARWTSTSTRSSGAVRSASTTASTPANAAGASRSRLRCRPTR